MVYDEQNMISSDKEASVVAAFEVMEHIPDTNNLLSKDRGVLRPNDYLLMSMSFLYGRGDWQDYY